MTDSNHNRAPGLAPRNPVLEIEGLQQRLHDPARAEDFTVFVPQRIVIRQGDFVALLGPSGCGKTTLLTVLGLLRAPSSPASLGRFAVWVDDRNGPREIDLREAWLRRRHRLIESIRRRHLGFALQSGELLPALTVHENIAAPLRLCGYGGRKCRARVDHLLENFALRRRAASNGNSSDGDLARVRVNKLSGGEYQRVALARAIAHEPRIVFVDEPTAALNRELARGALCQLQSARQAASAAGAIVMITHDEQLAGEFANVVIRMAPKKNMAAGEVVEVTVRDPQSTAASETTAAPHTAAAEAIAAAAGDDSGNSSGNGATR